MCACIESCAMHTLSTPSHPSPRPIVNKPNQTCLQRSYRASFLLFSCVSGRVSCGFLRVVNTTSISGLGFRRFRFSIPRRTSRISRSRRRGAPFRLAPAPGAARQLGYFAALVAEGGRGGGGGGLALRRPFSVLSDCVSYGNEALDKYCCKTWSAQSCPIRRVENHESHGIRQENLGP